MNERADSAWSAAERDCDLPFRLAPIEPQHDGGTLPERELGKEMGEMIAWRR